MKKTLILSATLLPLVLLPHAALAHPGHQIGTLSSGMAHPLGGADHILAMVALGLLAAQVGGRALWALPLSFVAAMLAGGLLGFAGAGFPAVEPVILGSVIVLGAMVALALRAPMPVLIAMVALFGAAHGWAHGAEGPPAGIAAYAAGFALATAALHGAGLLAGRVVPALALRGAGALAALSGAALVVG